MFVQDRLLARDKHYFYNQKVVIELNVVDLTIKEVQVGGRMIDQVMSFSVV